jgi:hypothetical protein
MKTPDFIYSISQFIFKGKGCLFNKTQEQKNDFFESLSNFAKTDPLFFKEQYLDLLPHERKEYRDWIEIQMKESSKIIKLIQVLTELLTNKKQINHAINR